MIVNIGGFKMTGEEQLIAFTKNNYQKKITKVNHRIYHFLGYGHSNAIAIIGETSIILVDSLDSDQRALSMHEELKKITDKPVKTIIYTHGHPDHQGGSGAFYKTVEEVIALTSQKPALKYYERLQDVLNRRGRLQHGYGLSDEEAICQGIGIREGKEVGEGKYNFLPVTTLYNQKIVERTIDGVKLKLVSAVGETDDQLYIWLEDDKVLCTGDNYYGCWPNLYAIRGSQYRDIATWIDSLEEILSYPAIALLPGHTKALLGYEKIQEVVGNFKEAIESVLLQTLDCMNQGMDIEDTVANVRLPQHLLDLPYLKEYYGTIEWSIKSIYTAYVGWFDGNPIHLLPVSQKEYAQMLVSLIDDTNKILNKIKECMQKDEHQMALQLIEMLQYVESNPELQKIKKEALLKRAKQVTSANARHYYIGSAKERTF